MKIFSYLIIVFIFGGFIFFERPNYAKPKKYVLKIDNSLVLKEQFEFNQWTVKISKQHQEIKMHLDSLK